MNFMISTCLGLMLFYQTNSCDIYDYKKLKLCREFFDYVQEAMEFDWIDLIFSIPQDKKFETEKALFLLTNLLHETKNDHIKFQIKPLIYNGQKPPIYQGVAKFVLADTMNMSDYLNKKNYELDTNSFWMILTTKNTVWKNDLILNYNSRVYIGENDKNEIKLYQLNAENGFVKSDFLGVWKEGGTTREMDTRETFEFEISLILFNDPPFVIVKNGNGNITIDGYLIDLWKGFEELIGIRSNFYLSNKTKEGFFDNGVWNGIIGEMITTKNDIALMVKHETTEVSHLFDSINVITLRLGIYQKKEIPNTWNMATEVKSNMVPFFLLLLSLLGGAILSWLGIPRKDAFFLILTIFFQQSCTYLPKRLPSRIATLSIMFMSLYVVTANIGDITSLIIQKQSTQILTMDDLKDPAINVIIVSQSSVHHILRESNDETLNNIYQRINKGNNFVHNVTQALNKVVNEGYVFLGVKERVDFFMKDYVDTVLSSATPYSSPGGLILKKHAIFKSSIYTMLLRMREMGFMSKIGSKWWSEKHQAPFSFEQVALINSWQLFANFYTGAFVSFLVLLLEKYYYKSAEKRFKSKNTRSNKYNFWNIK